MTSTHVTIRPGAARHEVDGDAILLDRPSGAAQDGEHAHVQERRPGFDQLPERP
jgi:hypothetical protein